MTATIEQLGKEEDKKFKVVFDEFSEVKIGGDKLGEFKPEILFKKWGEECWVKISLPTIKKIEPVFVENKIKWIDTEKEIHFYPLEPREITENGNSFKQLEKGGFEFNVILKKKPSSPEIALDIEAQGVKFFEPQPNLKNEERITQPDNVIGSIPVYRATKTSIYKSEAEARKYKAGKMGQFYYPYLKDFNDWEVRAERFSIENGKMKVKMPDDFWNNAVYPIEHVAGAKFGYEGIGSASMGVLDDEKAATAFLLTENADVSKITAYIGVPGIEAKGVIYDDDNGNAKVLKGTTNASAIIWSNTWRDFVFASAVFLGAGTYWLGLIIKDPDSNITIKADYEGGYKIDANADEYDDGPTNPWGAHDIINNYRLSVYATYEPVVAPSPNFTDKNNYNGYNAFVQQYIKHKINGTDPWANPDGTLL